MSLCRFAAPLLALASIWAAPPLTTIQDTIYKADGTRFNGIAAVEWKSFEAADTSVVATHSLSVRIANGLLRVQLVPTTNASPGAYYRVRYNSEGRIQFDETWAVPPSNTPLRLRDVRVGSGQVTPARVGTLISEADVSGLPADLAVRPVKGPGYFPSRIAFVSSTGALETVTGNSSDCVRVDGTAAPCGGFYVDGEVPGGAIDGSNATFALAGVPDPAASLAVHRNGLLQQRGVDFLVTGNTITFLAGSRPQAGDSVVVSYRAAGASGS